MAIFIKFNLSLKLAVLIQIAISGIAALILYRIANQISGSKAAAFISTFLFITWKDSQYLNCFILTESFFTSFLIFSFYFVTKVKSPLTLCVCIAVLLCTSILRPNGFVVLPAALIYFILANWPVIKPYRKGVLLLFVLLIPCSLFLLNRWLHPSYSIVEEYKRGEIIYGDAQFVLTPPPDLWMPNSDTFPLLKIALFIFHNPVFFFKIAVIKVIYFIGYIKPYHSTLHQVATIFVLYPMIFFTTTMLWLKSLMVPEKSFVFIALLMQMVIIAFTIEDWDNRFIIPFLPYFFVFGAIGLNYQLRKYLFIN